MRDRLPLPTALRLVAIEPTVGQKFEAMKSRFKKPVALLTAALLLYIATYFFFRQSRSMVLATEHQTYVMFPTRPLALYYFYRPLTYVDGMLTGMRFHIGPHQAPRAAQHGDGEASAPHRR